MENNVIILTTGLSGSSVVTSLISKAGYWTGDQTIKKNNASGNYDTYENTRLVELNNDLIKSISFKYDNDSEYQNLAHLIFEEAIEQIDNKHVYVEFIEYCDSKGSWIWKDPRLWVTIGFWQQILDKANIKILIIYRNPLPLWVSHLTKKQIVGYSYLKNIERRSRKELTQYLNSINMDNFTICYDELVLSPDKILVGINSYVNTKLSVDDFKLVYKGNIGSKTWTIYKLIKSILIYIKNFKYRKK